MCQNYQKNPSSTIFSTRTGRFHDLPLQHSFTIPYRVKQCLKSNVILIGNLNVMHFISPKRKQKNTSSLELQNHVYLCFCDDVPCLPSSLGPIMDRKFYKVVGEARSSWCVHTCTQTHNTYEHWKREPSSGSVLPCPAQVHHSIFAFPWDMEEKARVAKITLDHCIFLLSTPVICPSHTACHMRALTWETKSWISSVFQICFPFPQLQLQHSSASLWPHNDSCSMYTTHFILIFKVLNANAAVKRAEDAAKYLSGLRPLPSVINSLYLLDSIFL